MAEAETQRRSQTEREAATKAERIKQKRKELEATGPLHIEDIRNKAKQGYPDAQYLLGLDYCMVEEDMQEGIKWIRLSGENGYTEAQLWLAQYYNKEGPQKNATEVSYWSKKAGEGLGNIASKQLLFTLAEKGDRGAAHVIAPRYQEGTDGFEKDEREAVKWFLRAAELGHPDAQGIIGICYLAGHHVAQDRTTAIRWFQKAAANGNQHSKNWLRQNGY
jgi:TPR repeat protein